MKTIFKIVVVALASLPAIATANPRALPFTYTTDTLGAGQVEIEQFVDLSPRKALTAGSSTSGEWFLPSAFQTEIEIGLAERLELGLYMTFVPSVGEGYQAVGEFRGVANGVKQRLRYVFADLGEWPVDVGVYGEITENEKEIELEGKLLLQRRFGDVRIAANLSSEYELYFSHERTVVLNPSLGVTYEATAKLHLGVDAFLNGEYPLHPRPVARTFELGPEAYVGPAVMVNFGKLWWGVGAYLRVTDTGHTLQPGEPYGPLYVRTMLGYNL